MGGSDNAPGGNMAVGESVASRAGGNIASADIAAGALSAPPICCRNFSSYCRRFSGDSRTFITPVTSRLSLSADSACGPDLCGANNCNRNSAASAITGGSVSKFRTPSKS